MSGVVERWISTSSFQKRFYINRRDEQTKLPFGLCSDVSAVIFCQMQMKAAQKSFIKMITLYFSLYYDCKCILISRADYDVNLRMCFEEECTVGWGNLKTAQISGVTHFRDNWTICSCVFM